MFFHSFSYLEEWIKVAMIIGLDYKNSKQNQLFGTKEDEKKMKKILIENGFKLVQFEKTLRITFGKLIQKLIELKKHKKKNQKICVFCFFSLHGVSTKLHKEKPYNLYLLEESFENDFFEAINKCTEDYELELQESIDTIKAHSLNEKNVLRRLNQVITKEIGECYIIFDVCRVIKEFKFILDPRNKDYSMDKFNGIVLFSTKIGKKAKESHSGCSKFVKCLLEGFKKVNKPQKIEKIFNYVIDSFYGEEQTPNLKKEVGELQFKWGRNTNSSTNLKDEFETIKYDFEHWKFIGKPEEGVVCKVDHLHSQTRTKLPDFELNNLYFHINKEKNSFRIIILKGICIVRTTEYNDSTPITKLIIQTIKKSVTWNIKTYLGTINKQIITIKELRFLPKVFLMIQRIIPHVYKDCGSLEFQAKIIFLLKKYQNVHLNLKTGKIEEEIGFRDMEVFLNSSRLRQHYTKDPHTKIPFFEKRMIKKEENLKLKIN